jgi:DNA-binding NtrC family response regulator
MMSGHGTIDSAVEATRIGAFDFLEKPIAMQKLLATVKKALKHAVAPQKPPLTLDAFARSPLLKDLKKRLEQAAAKTPVLLLKSASGSIAEICARTLQTPKTPWLDLSASSAPLTQEMLETAGGGILFIADLMLLGKLQQRNLVYALERLEKHGLQLVAASTRPLSALSEVGWDPSLVARLGEVWVTLPQLAGHADDIPEIATLVLAHLVERNEVPARYFSSAALNALRLHHWPGEWAELLATIKNLALSALEDEISVDDVDSILQREASDAPKQPPALPLFDQPLRDAREAFERLYFEHHLKSERGNMTRVAEKTGLERTHLYRKLKQLGLNLGRRSEGQ